MKEPRKILPLTIVIPAYNSAATIGRTLDSVARQTALPEALIVVDNNSADDTAAVVEAWVCQDKSGLKILLRHEATPGATAARNRGLAEVTTEWVMFFDSDDEMLPSHLETAMALATAEADIVGWDLTYCNGRQRRVHKFNITAPLWHSLFHGTFGTLRWMARTDLVHRAGGWNPEIRLWDDIELGARLLALKPRIVKRNGAPQVVVHVSPTSMGAYRSTDYLTRMEAPLKAITATFPKASVWTLYVRAIHAGTSHRLDPKAAQHAQLYNDYIDSLKNRAATPRQRLAIAAAYRLTRAGIPGAARILALATPNKI